MKAPAEVMIGNFAIARGLVEAGLELAAAYPGTPSSEILPGIVEFNKREKGKIHAEWSTNERCALEVAFGAALSGKKAACMMKQVGLNVAFPSLMRGRDKRIEGALVIVSCDDPGPQSSQTEQDTRLLCTLFNIPVFDPTSSKEAGDVAYYALNYSFEHKTPVILRSTHRVSHAREAIKLFPPGTRKVTLNEGTNHQAPITKHQAPITKLGIIASGMSYSIAMDVISDFGLAKDIPIYKVLRIMPTTPPSTLRPLDPSLIDFTDRMDKVLVLEETDWVLEALLDSGDKILGRRNGYVPDAGELTYDVVRSVVERIIEEMEIGGKVFVPDSHIEEALQGVTFPPRPPKLCAGCPHRASFHAMSYAYPEAIFPGDIGCYTLGIAQGAVDTCIDMGGGVTLAAGFYDAFSQDENFIPIIASVGDSTFFHACLPPLYDAVEKQKRFILIIMDNSTTAMTGMQPTPQSGITADGTPTNSLKIEDIVRGLGIEFLRVLDPYDVPLMIKTIKEAYAYLTSNNQSPRSPLHAPRSTHKSPAVIIARRICLLYGKGKGQQFLDSIDLEQDCTGCKTCVTRFGCPALLFDEEKKKVKIDDGLCVKCGICLYACPRNEKGKGLLKSKGSHFIKIKSKL
ncbi:MAG: thiamine pyrophosphate-dependent enzyme [Proteobacteria bacterium]|nr:thiamine pyrophosphate-dependent enzyme [Pseudomonadota bacterium]